MGYNPYFCPVIFCGYLWLPGLVYSHLMFCNAEGAEVEQYYEDLQDLLELTPKKDVIFIIGDWNAKVGSQETPGC